jgi:acetamidase/formamidase
LSDGCADAWTERELELAGDLKIVETVDVPHMLVTMHMPKHIFVEAEPKG